MKKLLTIIATVSFLFIPSLVTSEGASAVSWMNRDNLRMPIDPIPAVHRFWSNNYKGHFYTTSSTEKNNIVATMPVWQYEGQFYWVYHPGICEGAPPGLCLPVYRFWNNTSKHHFYTISDIEKNNVMLTMPEWQYEGVAYAANTDPVIGGDPLYRFWSNTYKGHFYTSNLAERNNVIATMPEWQYEGVAYYVFNTYPIPE